LLALAERSSEPFTIEVDLDKQQVRWKDDSQKQVSSDFPLDPFWRECLLKGVDEIDLTLSYLPQIEHFETEYFKRNPWLVSP
jgi:3-isopropylmalate/(R)-2-methylmalate dehydratase small subunit